MFCRITSIAILSIVCALCAGQTSTIDSLKNVILVSEKDSNYVKTLVELSIQYRSIDAAEGRRYAEQAIEQAEEISFDRGIAVANYHKGVCNFVLGNYEDVEESLNKTLAYGVSQNDLVTQLFVKNILGITFNKIGDASRAIETLYESAELSAQLGDSLNYAIALNNIGEIHVERKEQEQAAKIFESIQDVFIKYGEPYHLGAVLVNLSAVFDNQEKNEYYSRQALKHGMKHSLNDVKAYALNSLGNILLNNQDSLLAAHRYFKDAIGASVILGEEYIITVSRINFGKSHRLLNQLTQAESYLTLGLESARSNNFVEQIDRAYGELSAVYEERQDYRKSLEYFKLQKSIGDSIYNADFSQQLMDANVKFNTEQKEAEIARQQLEIERQSNQRNLLIGGSVTGIGILGALFFGFYQRTKRKRRESEIALQLEHERVENLEKISRTKTDFFNNVSHELRTPLTLVMAPIEDALKKSQNQHVQKDLKLALNNSKRLLNLTNEILDLSKIDEQKLELHLSPTNVLTFLRRIFHSFDSLAASQNIELIENINFDDDLRVNVDSDKLEKILTNLISNAIKYSDEGGTVSMTVDVEKLGKSQINIQIADEGKGIPQEELPHIFDRFYQSTNTSHTSGTGIGLSLVKELTSIINGEIKVESEINKGSKFSLRIPIEIIEGELPTHEVIEERLIKEFTPISFNGHKPKILIVEDDLEMSNYLVSLLESNYNCTPTFNGQQAIEKLQSEKFDLITSDVMMPEMDGFEF